MERGLYAAASGMMAQQAIQEMLAQNIANANTLGYKQDRSTFQAFQGLLLNRLSDGSGRGPEIGELGVGVHADKLYTDWQTGPISQTNAPLDASLDKNQFFAVRDANGQERYTRAGNFLLDGAGNLVTSAGQRVLGADNNPINVGKRFDAKLDAVGNLKSGDQTLGKLKIVEAADLNGLEKDGDSLLRAVTPQAVRIAARPQLRVGTLEQSNMNVMQGLVQMILTSRSFETAQKALTTQDELLRQAATEVGKV